MVDDPDIFRAAKLLIDQHGDDAAIRAAERADKLLEDGDIDGALVWRRILAAIEELQRERRDDEAVNYGRDVHYWRPPHTTYVWLSRIRLPPRVVFDGEAFAGSLISRYRAKYPRWIASMFGWSKAPSVGTKQMLRRLATELDRALLVHANVRKRSGRWP